MTQKDLTIIELTEENIESMIYEIRGQRAMLDFDLARIYGYTTRDFNNQVKHNIERFDNDFMFELTEDEVKNILRLKKSTANQLSSKRRYNPYAFTEQGIYMLMTVLRGELAIKQSKALIRLFKKMKDIIVENRDFIPLNSSLINDKFTSYDKRLDAVENKLDNVMSNFINPLTYKHFLILNGQKLEADLAYQQIYALAKHSIFIIDDYIDVKTLRLLLGTDKSIEVIIYSDNASRNPLTQEYVDYFIKESQLKITIKPTNNLFHDRFIVIDYSTKEEQLFLSGPSSKDAGKKIGTIIKIEDTMKYHSVFESLFRKSLNH